MQRRTEFFYCRKLLVGELVELVNLDVGTGFLLRLVAGYSFMSLENILRAIFTTGAVVALIE